MRLALFTAEVFILGFFAIATLLQLLLTVSAGLELRHVRRMRADFDTHATLRSPFAPTVSILVPAYNEEAMITFTLDSMLAIEYPGLEVVVINDGSSDATLQQVLDHFEMHSVPAVDAGVLDLRPVNAVHRSAIHPNLVVIDKPQGGKSDALNVGLLHASSRLVCAVDADTIIEPDAVERLVEPFMQNPDLLAAGGSVRPANSSRFHHGRLVERRLPTNLLAALQGIEYARAFLFGRLGWNRLGGNIIISGAFGLFNREAVIDAGGYLEETVGEDMELVLRLRRRAFEEGRPNDVSFLPEPMAWTEVPESMRTLARQRNRWHRGLLDTLWHHRSMIGRRRYGRVGLVVLPYYIVEALAPLLEALGLIVTIVALATGSIGPTMAAAYFLLAYGFSVALSAVAVGFEDKLDDKHQLNRGRIRRLIPLFLEQISYRQLTVVWRLWGVIAWIKKDKQWGVQDRQGIDVGTGP